MPLISLFFNMMSMAIHTGHHQSIYLFVCVILDLGQIMSRKLQKLLQSIKKTFLVRDVESETSALNRYFFSRTFSQAIHSFTVSQHFWQSTGKSHST
jgi:hypothetical protein